MNPASNRAASMEPTLRFKIGGVGFFRRGEKAQVEQFPADVNTGLKFLLRWANTKKTKAAIAARMALVFEIQPIVRFAQVLDGVVRAVSVDVIDLVNGPSAVNVQPASRCPLNPRPLILMITYPLHLFFLSTCPAMSPTRTR